MNIINNNNNNVPIGEHYHVSWYTKQSSDIFNSHNKDYTYTGDEEETISTQWVEGTYS